jgi:hypothetical protein
MDNVPTGEASRNQEKERYAKFNPGNHYERLVKTSLLRGFHDINKVLDSC